MSTKLIAHLKKKCEEDGNVAILFAQWEFDQKLVGKALENIGGFYPHFSNHNASHSQQILVNIERILGSDVDLLSATDTWLILEAAYWHDVGMLVDAKNAKEVHTNPDFHFMIQTIANEKGHDLQKFCQAYVEKNWLSAIGTVDHPFDGVEKYRQLIAEWFRRGHDKRVGKLVEDPFKDLGITSPRTELIPNRIYRYLGQICVSHGMSFESLMAELRPKQTGMGTENCHPRFIGCLLRLGDLFDLDDNRFCPVMAKHVSNMPLLSKHHHNKHLSLREFQLDKRTVKLVAECPDEMSYVETQNWFGWIREEFQNQMSQWNLIVPNQNFGSLPTIEQLEVRIDGNKELLNHKPMKFSLEEKNAIQILQGANLYKDISSILRELIQNSIDATQIRVWLEHEDKLLKLSPLHVDFKNIIENYPIKIDFIEKEDIWYLIIEDNGVGFSLEDLNYVQKIAGSDRNLTRKKTISNMPQWLKPSSYFGIGLQSAFLLADRVCFESKSYITNDCFSVEMHSPLKNNKGYCFIRKNQDSKKKIGTKFEIPLDIKKLQNSFFVKDNYLKKIGFVERDEDEKRKLVFLEIIKKIRETFSYDCNVQIKFDNQLEENLNEISNKNIKKNDNIPMVYNHTYWNKKLNLKILIQKKTKISNNYNSVRFYFKGQFSSSGFFNSKLNDFNDLYNIGVDFYGLNAIDCLNVNRDSWLTSFVKFFNNSIFEEIIKDILDKKNGFELIDLEFFSLVKVLYANDYSYMKNISFLTNRGVEKFGQIVENNKFYITNDYFSNYDSVIDKLNIENYLIIKSMSLLDSFFKSVVGFFFYKVEGFSLINIQGHIGILFTKDQIECDNKNIFKIEGVLNDFEYFLRTNILSKCEHEYVREDDESFFFL